MSSDDTERASSTRRAAVQAKLKIVLDPVKSPS
jgi:hypothetical protein